MKEIKTVHLNSGWEDKKFSQYVTDLIKLQSRIGWEYYDIKISSKGNNSLLIFKKVGK